MFDEYNDTNIIKIQHYLKKGYEIIGKSFRHKDGITIDEIEIAKGNKTKVLSFKNPNKELSRYLASIHFVYDEHYNRIPIFQDPDEYYSDKNILKPGKLPNSYIEIDGIKFSNFDFLNLVQQVNAPSRFRFSIDISLDNNKKFFEIDFRNNLRLFVEDEVKFNGQIVTFLTDRRNQRFDIICEDPMGLAKLQKIGMMEFEIPKGYGPNVAAFIADLMDLNYSGDSIHGLDENERDFMIIVPLKNFSISDIIKIGEVEIINSISGVEFLSDN